MGRRRARMREEEYTPAPVQRAKEEHAATAHPDPVVGLSHLVGNRTLSRLLRGEESAQRAAVTPDDTGPVNDPGTAEMTRLEQAQAAYEAVRGTGGPAELQGILRILDAITAWRESEASPDSAGGAPFVNGLLQEVKQRFEAIVNEHREMWAGGHFTDPAQHNPAQYQYLINAIAEYNGPGEVEPQQITETLHDPAKLQNMMLSLSVINNFGSPAWGPSGFIVRAPKENIYAAGPAGGGAQNAVSAQHESHIYRQLVRLFLANGLPLPAQVMQGMKRHEQGGQFYEQNEVTAIGLNRVTQKAAEATGIFVITDKGVDDPLRPITLFETVGTIKENGRDKRLVRPVPAVSNERMKLYLDLVKKYNLPMIALPLADTSRFKAQPGKPGPWASDMVLERR